MKVVTYTLVPVSVRLTFDQLEHLRQLARVVSVAEKQDISVSDIIRDLLDEYYSVPRTSDEENAQLAEVCARRHAMRERGCGDTPEIGNTTTTGSSSVTVTIPHGVANIPTIWTAGEGQAANMCGHCSCCPCTCESTEIN